MGISMKLDEAKEILKNNGYLLETEDKGNEIGDFLKTFGFRHKPHSIFGLYKPIKRTPYEFFAMFGMCNCNITVSYWDWDKNKRVVVDKIDIKYNEDPNTFEKIEDFINRNKNPGKPT